MQRAVSKRMVIPLQDIVDSKGSALVAGDRKAHRVGTLAGWETGACSARIAEVAEPPDDGFFRLPGQIGNRPADARPSIPQGENRGGGPRFHGIEVGAGHFDRYRTTGKAPT